MTETNEVKRGYISLRRDGNYHLCEMHEEETLFKNGLREIVREWAEKNGYELPYETED